MTACGNSTVGIFGGGTNGSGNSAITDKYTYSNDSRTGGTVLGTARYGLAACGNSTVGIFGGGFTSTYVAVTDKYTYSGDVVASGTVLGTARYYLAASSNVHGGL